MKLFLGALIAVLCVGAFGWLNHAPKTSRLAVSGRVGTHPAGIGIAGQQTPLDPAPGDSLVAFSAGCFWGSEQAFRKMPGIVATAVGYTGGTSTFPTEEVAHRTGHAETVLVEFDPRKTSFQDLLKTFWKLRTAAEPDNDATQKSPYRAVIWTYSADEQKQAEASKLGLEQTTHEKLRTQIQPAKPFYLAEDFHQQYDEKSGTEACPIEP